MRYIAKNFLQHILTSLLIMTPVLMVFVVSTIQNDVVKMIASEMTDNPDTLILAVTFFAMILQITYCLEMLFRSIRRSIALFRSTKKDCSEDILRHTNAPSYAMHTFQPYYWLIFRILWYLSWPIIMLWQVFQRPF